MRTPPYLMFTDSDSKVSITLGINKVALQVSRNLDEASRLREKAFQRLSSGMRINSASDDAAGLAVASALNAKSIVFNQAVRNMNDGISVLNIADATTSSLVDIVIRMKELATQAANGTLGAKQREALDLEAQQLSKEYFRVSRSANFNGLNLFDGSVSQLSLQAGFGAEGALGLSLGAVMGNGAFQAGTTYSGTSYNGVVTGDLNGDGNLDLVSYSAANIMVQFGAGNGTFGATSTYAVGSVNSVLLSDINADGILDLISTGSTGTGFVNTRIGNGDGTFRAAVSFVGNSFSSVDVAAGDINGDGKIDLATIGPSGTSSIFLGTGNGTFGLATSFATVGGVNEVNLADFNGDGVIDLLHGSPGGWSMWLGNGNGTFRSGSSPTSNGVNISNVRVADLNADGALDLVDTGTFAGAGAMTVRLGRGDGTFLAPVSYAAEASASYGLEIGDFNGDGILDAVTAGWTGTSGQISVRLGLGNGTLGALTSFAAGANSNGTDIGDFNNDGVLDIAGSAGSIFLGGTRSGVAPLLPFNLRSRTGALAAGSLLDQKLNHLFLQQASIGAAMSRVDIVAATTRTAQEQFEAAGSRILDADVAREAAELTRTSMLQRAASAILSNSTLDSGLVLTLLRYTNGQ